jgi:UDP-N-acetylmuramoylalanine-D-glutamate ligase
MSKDKFKSIPDVIKHDMTDAQREQLAASVLAVIADFSVEDYAMLLELVLNNSVTTEAVLKVVFAFIQEEMQQEIVDKNEGISHINDTLQTDEYFENDTSLLVLANQKQMY